MKFDFKFVKMKFDYSIVNSRILRINFMTAFKKWLLNRSVCWTMSPKSKAYVYFQRKYTKYFFAYATHTHRIYLIFIFISFASIKCGNNFLLCSHCLFYRRFTETIQTNHRLFRHFEPFIRIFNKLIIPIKSVIPIRLKIQFHFRFFTFV